MSSMLVNTTLYSILLKAIASIRGSSLILSGMRWSIGGRLKGLLLGREDKGASAGDGGVDEVQQRVGLIAALEGQAGCYICTEGQQPASDRQMHAEKCGLVRCLLKSV